MLLSRIVSVLLPLEATRTTRVQADVLPTASVPAPTDAPGRQQGRVDALLAGHVVLLVPVSAFAAETAAVALGDDAAALVGDGDHRGAVDGLVLDAA